MSKEQLKHIFEPSACLTPKQMKGYVSGKMVHEEAHAVEVHLLSCPFCSDAIEGLQKEQKSGSITAMEKLDAGFIAKHFGIAKDELNIGAAPVTKTQTFKTFTEKISTSEPSAIARMWKPIAAAASLVAVICVLWFMRDTIFPKGGDDELAQQIPVVEKAEPEVTYRPVEVDSAADEVAVDTTVAEPGADDAIEKETLLADASVTEELAKKKARLDSVKQLLAKKEAEAKKLAEKNAKDKNAEGLLAGNAAKKQTVAAPTTTATAPTADERPRMGNSFAADDINSYSNRSADAKKAEAVAEPPAKKKIELGTARSGILKGDEAFNDGKYKKALKLYQKVMFDPQSNQKDAATLMAAKCHIAMEENMQARTLLNSLINDNSYKKDEAAGLLKQVGE